jgi:hypothetical protein
MIKQLSIFINNEPGRLAAIAKVLSEEGINIKAFNIAESSGFGVLRAIVDDPDPACVKIKDRGIIVKETEVIAIPLEDTPGGLFQVAKVLGEANINIEYGYAYSGKKISVFFFRVDDIQPAIRILKEKGITVLTGDEF